MLTDDEIRQLIDEHENCGRLLFEHTAEAFPPGCVVLVIYGREHKRMFGIVMTQGECPPGSVPIYHESGNVWNKPLLCLLRIRDVKQWPRWVRDQKMKRLRFDSEMRKAYYAGLKGEQVEREMSVAGVQAASEETPRD